MDHSPGFLKLVQEAMRGVREISVADARETLAKTPGAILIDVREDKEWEAGHASEARHFGRGIIERDIEKQIPEKDKTLILYCGGGFRSALSAESLQKMGYENVLSLAGGYKAMMAAGWPMAR